MKGLKLKSKSKSKFFNPFSELAETREYPLARILRTSFGQKLADTYRVFAGNHPSLDVFTDSPQKHLGLLDYLSFGLPYLLLDALEQADIDTFQTQELPLKGLMLLLILINAPLGLLRIGVGTGLTLAVSPLVGAVHLVSRKQAQAALQEIEDSLVYVDDGGRYMHFKEACEHYGWSLDELEFRGFRNGDCFFGKYAPEPSEFSSLAIRLPYKQNDPEGLIQLFTRPRSQGAFFQLNIGRITEKVGAIQQDSIISQQKP